MIEKARWAGLCLAMLIAVPCAAAAPDPEARAEGPRASQVLRSMADFLAAAQHFSFHAETSFDTFTASGQKALMAGAGDVTVERPNRLHADFRDDLAARKVWYDGKEITLLDPTGGFYAVEPVTGDIDAMLAEVQSRFDLRMPLAELVSTGLYDKLAEHMQRASYLGIHDVEGTACHHLALRLDEVDLQVWVELGDDPLARKIVIDYRGIPGTPRYTAVLMDWRFSQPAREVFRAKIPDGADRIGFLPTGSRVGEVVR